MAATITGASLSDIYERLNDLPSYNPMSSDTFSDWSTEAGDMVTMVRDEEEYEVPVHSSRMIWRGFPEISLSATGKKQRDPVASVSKAKYGRGSGMNNNQENSKKIGNKVFTGMDTPQDANEGDIWVKSPLVRTWDEGEFDWDSATNLSWPDLAGSQNYVYKDGVWKLTMDEQVLIDREEFYKTKDSVGLLAAKVVANQEQSRAEFARLDVRADAITATVIEAVQGLGSEIYQTATQIRSEVHASSSTLYSYIDQTATYIRSEVADVANGLSSSITQTASQIRSEVNASNSQIYSSITQTASSIRMEVASSVSGLQSSITQESNRISLVVEGTGSNAKIKPASIVAAINNGESSIIISASHINLDGYVKATDLTTSWLSTKIAAISNLSVNNVTATSVKVLVGQNLSDVATQTYVSGCPYDLRLTSSGNTYTLQWKRLGYTAEWADIGSFSRAVSSFVTGGGSGYVNVTALPQNQTQSVKVSIDGSNSITSNGTYTYSVDYENADGDDVPTGATKTVTVNVPSGSHSISITPDNVGHSDEPTGTRLWSTTTFQKNKWYKFTVNCGTAQKVYKILINTP